MPVYPLINSFNAGEMSPYLIGRVDLEKYATGCQRMENFRALPYGGAVLRPGTEFIHQLIGEYRLKEFIYSTETSYVLAFGENVIKIYRDGAYLSSSDVVTTYSPTDAFELQFLQINDVMYITHPDHPVKKLSRVTATSFTLASVVYSEPAFLDLNLTATTITPSSTSGAITLASSAPIFEAGHVGSYWKIEHFRSAGDVQVDITSGGTSGNIEVRGGWRIRTSGTWDATVLVKRSYNGGVDWEIVASYTRQSDGNVDESGTEEITALMQLEVTGYNTDGGDGPVAVLSVTSDYGGGIVQITAFTDASNVDATVTGSLISSTATSRWYEGAWSEVRGYPKCVGIFEERIYYANTYHEPQRIWGSRVGAYEDMSLSADDDAGVSYAIADTQQNPIQWLLGERSLLFATTSAQWTLDGGQGGDPVTPSNVKVQRQPSNLGTEAFQPVSLPGITLFLQRGGRKFRELFYQFVESSYSAQDVTLLAEHITKGGIVQFAASNHPDSIAYAVRADGQMAVMVYERGQANGGAGNLVAWSRYVTDGSFKSVAIIPGDIEDEVWVAVSRTDGGANYTCIERFRPRLSFLDDRSDWYFLDCGRTVDVYRETFITTITRIQYGANIDVDGVASQRVSYLVNTTGHGYTHGDFVRIENSGFTELNGNVYKVLRASSNTYYLGDKDVSPVSISAITQANPGVVTTAAAFPVATQAYVFFSGIVGMTQLNSTARGATFTAPTILTLNISTAAFTAYTSGGVVDLLAGTVLPLGWTTTSANGTATRVTNAFKTASILGVREQTLVADGSPVAGTVTASTFDTPTQTGTGTSDTYGSVLHCGLPYTGYLQPNPIETALQMGASTSVKKRVARLTLRFNNSVGCKVGPDPNNLQVIPFRSTADSMDSAIPGFTGTYDAEPNMDIVQSANVLIVQDEPLNCEVLAVAVKAEFYP